MRRPLEFPYFGRRFPGLDLAALVALYQGTTSVVPLEIRQLPGF
jgi:hypothetical protein